MKSQVRSLRRTAIGKPQDTSPDLTLAVADHNVPTKDRDQGITEPESRLQVRDSGKNAHDFGVEYFP